MSHGYNLTPLGCLLWTPFTCDENNNGFNVQIIKGDMEVSSVGYPYSELQKQLVFELQRNGTVNYWFKKDYLKGTMDTITLNGWTKISISHQISWRPNKIQTKNYLYNRKLESEFQRQYAYN